VPLPLLPTYIYIGEKGEDFGQKIGELEGNMLGTQEN